jgi:uncharacterized protein (DUF1330 family)
VEATIVVLGTFKEGYEKLFPEYSRKVRAFLSTKGAVVIRRQLIERTIYGESPANLVMLIDFGSAETAARCFLEAEYLDLIPLRDQVFASFNMYLARIGEI